MNTRKIWFYGSFIVTFSTIIILITGSSLLTIYLDDSNSIPIGPFITWAGMVSLPLAIYSGVEELRTPNGKWNKILARLLKSI